MPFAPGHVAGAVRLSRLAGWPHRPQDWQMALALSQGIAAVDHGGDVVGTILVTAYQPHIATINMVIVDANRRGQGLGRRLMEAALGIAGDMALRLVSTKDGLALYKRLGFCETGTIRQHQGLCLGGAALPGPQAAGSADMADIVRLDRAAFGADRTDLLRAIADIGQFAVLRRDGRVTGFAALRPFGRGEVIGPVVAPTLEDAKALLSFSMARRTGAFLRVDTPAASLLGPWLCAHGLLQIDEGTAMQRAPIAPSPAAPPFALASQAFG